ncbi:MAG: hypothetical protein LQ341_007585 [Variospora aurantia]|nr:MAG: hypothetical protein LQ341_007585 [Variospora aurantia]
MDSSLPNNGDIIPAQNSLSAIEKNNVSSLREILEAQDRTLLSKCARAGTPDIAKYLLARYPPLTNNSDDKAVSPSVTPEEAYLTTYIRDPSPTHHAVLYLLKESARNGNAAVFRSLSTAHPTFLTTHNRNIECVLVNAIEGGIAIWEVILSHDPRFVDHEFSGHKGRLLEVVVTLGGLTACYGWRTSEEKKRKAMDVFAYLLERGADLERAGDPVVPLLKVMRADERVIELAERWSGKV